MNDSSRLSQTGKPKGPEARDTPEVQSGRQKRALPLAWHPGDLERAARRRLPRAIFDYVDGGSYDEVTLRANRADLEALRLRQRVFCEPGTRKQSTTIAGQEARIPVVLGPIGFAGLVRPRGEIHAAKAAQSFGVPYCLSTFSTCSMEEVRAAVDAPFFFQLYLFKDDAVNKALLERAEAVGCRTLVLTLDTPVQGRRNRDLDNGLVVPLRVRLKLALQIIAKPWWGIGYGRSHRTIGNLAMFAPRGAGLAEISVWAERNHRGPLTKDDVAWVRKNWPHRLILKGILDAEDALTAIDLGADGVVVSNHGGRQLDGALSTARAFPAIQEAVGGRTELIFDGGVRSGLDVLKALALGAKGCLVGRAYLYGLAAHGQAGVEAALQLMSQELDSAMAFTCVSDVAAVKREVLIGG